MPTDTQGMAEMVRSFAAGRVAPGVIERDREERFDRELIREAGALDLLLSLIHISSPRDGATSRMPSSA